MLRWEMICSLCFEDASTKNRYGSPSHLVAFSRSVEPRSLDSCRWNVASYKIQPPPTFVAHNSCFKIVQKIVEPKLDPDRLHSRLVRLADSLRYRWPVPPYLRRMRTKRIAMDSFERLCQSTQFSRADPCLHDIMKGMKTLPYELRAYIFEISASSGLEKICMLRAMAGCLLSDTFDHISIESQNKDEFGLGTGEILGLTYLTQTSISADEIGRKPIIASFDDVACLDISHLGSKRESLGAQWYRILTSEDFDDISISYKVPSNPCSYTQSVSKACVGPFRARRSEQVRTLEQLHVEHSRPSDAGSRELLLSPSKRQTLRPSGLHTDTSPRI